MDQLTKTEYFQNYQNAHFTGKNHQPISLH
jgi:hypothetical protein